MGAASNGEQGAPVGSVAHFPQATAPAGWLKCNGAAISRASYAALFAVIGTTFGVGDGSTTFNLPDLRGEFVRALDDGRGVDSGRILGSAQGDLFKSHSHTVSSTNMGTSYSSILSVVGNSASGQTPATDNTGGVETRPRNVALLACIKY